ncbi:ATP-dependent helicase [Acaryochloris thomasi]|nr:ATP-dependent helicase [Acaryochloris thomasi]
MEDLNLKLEHLKNSLRPGQRSLADWQSGPLAVSAVPGAGKSYGMAAAAAIALSQNRLNRSRQLVLVTFTRSAAANLKHQIRRHLRDLNQPLGGFIVHTLHGLALNIASRHPQLSGLRLDQITLVSPSRRHELIRRCVDQWVIDHRPLYQLLMEQGSFDGEETERLRRQSVLRTDVLPALAEIAVREAKSSGLSPQALYAVAQDIRDDLPVVAIASGLYERYQDLLQAQQRIDYDDMILAALRVLNDPQAKAFWHQQVFAVFEDEAQDSTPLQTQLLEILSETPNGLNLVRVGDPNQAINSTFTPADPIFFREFCRHNPQHTMDQAGRSAPIIMEAANHMLRWVNESGLAGTELPFTEQAIHPVPLDDPQPNANPEPEGQGLEIVRPNDVYKTVDLLGQRVIELFIQGSDRNAAVLVRENKQGRFIAELLSDPERYGLSCDLAAHEIEVFDVGSRDRRSHIPAEMLTLLKFLARPHSPAYLKAALTLFLDRQLIPAQEINRLASRPEQFLYPGPLEPAQAETVRQARNLCAKLLRARWELPHYQLISFSALALHYDPAELATADKLSSRLFSLTEGAATMATTLPALQELVSTERFEPVEVEETSESGKTREETNPYLKKGRLTIITMHKAKGLDWDYVFLPFLHERVIPGELWVPETSKFLGGFTLAEVARAQIRALVHGQPIPDIDQAWQQASDLKIAEEFRLLYVAMTRAKRLLWMSAAQKAPFIWHTFDWQRQDSLQVLPPCPVIKPLQEALTNDSMQQLPQL